MSALKPVLGDRSSGLGNSMLRLNERRLSQKTALRDGTMAQQLRALSALPEDQILIAKPF